MDCKGRVLVELVDSDLLLSCQSNAMIQLVDESQSPMQEILLLLLGDNMIRDNSSVVFIGKDMEDDAMMLQTVDGQEFLRWVPFDIENLMTLEVKGFGKDESNVFSLFRQGKYMCMKRGSTTTSHLALCSEKEIPSMRFRLLQVFLDVATEPNKPVNPLDSVVSGEEGSDHSGENDGPSKSLSCDDGFTTVHFHEGALGMTLRRRADGIVYVHDVEENTQAAQQGVQVGDELWSVGVKVLGNDVIVKDMWTEIVKYIKGAERPLKMVLLRNEKKDATASSSSQVLSATPTVSPTSSESVTSVSPETRGDSAVSHPDDSNHATVEKSQRPVSHDDTPVSPISNDSGSASPVSLESADMASLRKLASRLIIKEKEKAAEGSTVAPASIFSSRLLGGAKAAASPVEKSSQAAADIIVKEGRRIVKHGNVSVAVRRTLWNVQVKKYIFLLTDILLVTVNQGDKFAVETIIDLATCKVNIRVETDLLDSATTNMKNVFELLYPGGSIIVVCDDEPLKREWVGVIYDAIIATVGQGGIGWKHQYMLGTMHSAVLSRDIRKVTNLLESCLAGDLEYADMETQDEEGYTPLHYACLLRLNNITRVLHESNSDVTIPDSRGLTAIHWAALQLDSVALDMLCSHVFNVDIVDDKERTPLYLACVEGRDVQGHTDIQSLQKCVACLMKAGANPNLRDKEGLTVLHYLSASWQYQVIETMISTVNSLTTIAPGTHVVNLNIPDMDGWSALHFACSGNSLKRVMGEGQRIIQSHTETGDRLTHDIASTESEPTRLEDSIGTLRILLRHGVFPNMKDHKGRRPIDIMAANMSRWTGNLQPSLLLLMAHGARIEEGIPEELKTPEATIVFEEGATMWTKAPLLNGDDIGLRLKSLEGFQIGIPVAADSKTAPCSLCMAQFTMFRRQHHCRLCDALCCNECSTKRMTLSKAPVRVCDSCFNIGCNRADFLKAELLMNGKGARLPSRSDGTNAENRDLLFGDAKKTDGNDKNTVEATKSSSEATMASMAEAKQRLHERGEKLEQLSDKSAKLADASKEFANLAKQLRQQNQQQSWW